MIADRTAELNALLAWKSDYAQDLEIDVVITTNEVNLRHGTGVLVRRVLAGWSNLFSIRFQDDWGDPEFGRWNIRLPQPGQDRWSCFRNILRVLGDRRVNHVVCVPFRAEELLTAIAIRDLYGARLCTYVMDDANVGASGEHAIPDSLMREFLGKCSLRLATHPELRAAYQQKFGLPVYLLPAIVADSLISTAKPLTSVHDRGALLGSFWEQAWFDRLCDALAPSGVEVDWFGNAESPWVRFPERDLQRARIRPRGIVDEEFLAAELPRYPFVIAPVSALDRTEKNEGVASLSLPGRIIFAAVTGTPVLVVGHAETCAARFVKRFGIGEVVPYDAGAVNGAMKKMRDAEPQRTMRSNTARIAPAFSDRGIGEWLRESIRLGRAADTRFEDVFAGY